MKDILRNGLKELNIDFSEEQITKIDIFYELLSEKNRIMNLTRITDKKEFYVKHILDSLIISEVIRISDQKIMDLGTGAGFPGIPLKVFFNDIDLTLIDSVNKKLLFVDEVIDKIDLDKINTVHGRAEDLGHDPLYREKFDIITSRAVANLSTLAEFCIPFIKKNGLFIAYKSFECDEEIKDASYSLKKLNSSVIEIREINIPETNIVRKMIKIKKNDHTPDKYPRKPGIPSKNPLSES